MGVSARALIDTRHAFDGVAAGYDRSNRENPILARMRARALRALTAHVVPGQHVLDLGCGPGTDAETLGRRGVRVTAVDWSPAMVDEAVRRIAAAGLSELVTVRPLGIHQIDRVPLAAFDAAYSNFGPLNCVPRLGEAARLIAGRLRPGGVLVASVIGRLCPWEVVLYVLRGDLPRARLRFAKHFVPVPLEGRTVWTRYYSPTEFLRPFTDAGFELLELRALGLFVPPPYLRGFADRHPRIVGALQWLDDRLGGAPVLRHWGDHFLVTLRRGPSAPAGPPSPGGAA